MNLQEIKAELLEIVNYAPISDKQSNILYDCYGIITEVYKDINNISTLDKNHIQKLVKDIIRNSKKVE